MSWAFNSGLSMSSGEDAHRVQAVHCVPGEAGEGLGEDHVNAAPLAGGDYPLELRPFLHAGAVIPSFA